MQITTAFGNGIEQMNIYFALPFRAQFHANVYWKAYLNILLDMCKKYSAGGVGGAGFSNFKLIFQKRPNSITLHQQGCGCMSMIQWDWLSRATAEA